MEVDLRAQSRRRQPSCACASALACTHNKQKQNNPGQPTHPKVRGEKQFFRGERFPKQNKRLSETNGHPRLFKISVSFSNTRSQSVSLHVILPSVSRPAVTGGVLRYPLSSRPAAPNDLRRRNSPTLSRTSRTKPPVPAGDKACDPSPEMQAGGERESERESSANAEILIHVIRS